MQCNIALHTAQRSATYRRFLPSGNKKNNTQSFLRSALFGPDSQLQPRILAKDVRSKATKEEVDGLLSQIGRDLAPWVESGISLKMVEKAYCSEEIGESMRFQVTLLFESTFCIQTHLCKDF